LELSSIPTGCLHTKKIHQAICNVRPRMMATPIHTQGAGIMNIARLTCSVAFAVLLGAAGTTSALAESTNSQTFEGWANDTAPHYNGRIPRDVYMDEMGRRWESDVNRRGTRAVYMTDLRGRWERVDRDNRGLTPVEISRMTGKVDSSTSGLPMTGAGAQPGNMGPSNSKGQ
jgi:hypothetical protein